MCEAVNEELESDGGTQISMHDTTWIYWIITIMNNEEDIGKKNLLFNFEHY